ncbi:hypothetical protein ACLB2K_052021 [Fragaria x ananassa]
MILPLQKIGYIAGPDQEAIVEVAKHRNLDSAKIVVVFCSASAIDMALLSAQLHSQLPIIFYFLALAILFAFTSVFISIFVHSSCPEVAQVFQQCGVFFGVTAVFISISVPFPVWFKWTTCFIYALSWLVIILCNYFYVKEEDK